MMSIDDDEYLRTGLRQEGWGPKTGPDPVVSAAAAAEIADKANDLDLADILSSIKARAVSGQYELVLFASSWHRRPVARDMVMKKLKALDYDVVYRAAADQRDEETLTIRWSAA